ncbi:MAG: D-alanine--D-alanine ligase [Alphaproteobacteria bacterium ADurb.Bin438]|nr:MAG: D-alanine--D-alanine ligase [Alphaproteobacteria bacterium ADurb.Bin438]
MKIGITYDLKDDYLKEGFTYDEVAEFDSLETIDGIDNSLKELGYETDRIGNSKALLKRLVNGDKWDMVFNITEGSYGIAREALVPALLESFKIKTTFASAATLALCLDKGMTKRVLSTYGFKTAPFYEVKCEADIDKVNLKYPLFAKPIAEGTSKGINGLSKISNKQELETICKDLLKKYNQPVLVEGYLSGREFTVGIVGSGDKAKVVGNIEIKYKNTSEMGIYSFDNKANYESRLEYVYAEDLKAKEVEKMALEIYKSLELKDAGRVDIRLDDEDVPNFIEVNPLAGLNYKHSDLPIICYKQGLKYNDLINEIVMSARER